ncbi:MAG: hypothetical protein ACXVAY_08135 [Mucilaginibacter sp.]
MDNQPHIIPRIAIQSMATGLLMMTLFTMAWAGIAHVGLNGKFYYADLIFFGVLSITFLSNAIYFLSTAKRFPKTMSAEDITIDKKKGRRFGIIFIGEGLGIFIAVNVVVNIGHPELVVPAIALVVGLHFFPMGRLFKRTMDYYTGTWSVLIAVLGMIFALNKILTENEVFAFVGIGLALSTSCYGLYMIYRGRTLINKSVLNFQD